MGIIAKGRRDTGFYLAAECRVARARGTAGEKKMASVSSCFFWGAERIFARFFSIAFLNSAGSPLVTCYEAPKNAIKKIGPNLRGRKRKEKNGQKKPHFLCLNFSGFFVF
jgi:hypothetical protein